MKDDLIIRVFVVSALLTGCATTQDDKAKIPLDSDPRVGEEVQQVCFVRDLDGWQNVDNDRKAVILRMRNRETFKLKLVGSCDPGFANLHLAVDTSPGTGCFSAGYKVKTGGEASRGYGLCKITSIHRWDAMALSKTEKARQ